MCVFEVFLISFFFFFRYDRYIIVFFVFLRLSLGISAKGQGAGIAPGLLL